MCTATDGHGTDREQQQRYDYDDDINQNHYSTAN